MLEFVSDVDDKTQWDWNAGKLFKAATALQLLRPGSVTRRQILARGAGPGHSSPGLLQPSQQEYNVRGISTGHPVLVSIKLVSLGRADGRTSTGWRVQPQLWLGQQDTVP